VSGNVHFRYKSDSPLKGVLIKLNKLFLCIKVFVVKSGQPAYGQGEGLVLSKMYL